MDSKTYWEQREKEALKHYVTEEAEYQKRIDNIYANMLDEINGEIERFYGRYATVEGISIAEAKKRVSEVDIKAYERKAKQYVDAAQADMKKHGKDYKKQPSASYYFSKHANDEMRLYNATMKINRLEMLKANIGLEMIKGHAELETFMEDILQGRTEDELKRQAGILGDTIRENAKAAHAIVNGSWQNGTFSDRIWQYQDIMRQDLGRILQTGLIQGKNPRALTKDLRKYWYGNDPKTGGGAKYCMERLMRTELTRVQTEAQKQSFDRMGFDEYTFHANSGCCDACQSKDGKHFKVKDMMPGENAAPMHPNCRCSCSAYEDSKEYEEWLDYLSKGGTTEEWNKLKEKPKTEPKTKNWSPNFDKYSQRELQNALLSSGKYSFDEILGMDESALRSSMGSVWKDAANKVDDLRKSYKMPKNSDPKELSEWLRSLPEDKIPDTFYKQSTFQRYSLLNLHDDLPEIVTDLSKKDGISLYRGVRDAATIKGSTICEMTKYDPNAFVGAGIYGDGLYLTTVKAGTEIYGSSGSIKAKLKPNAKVIDYDSIEEAMKKDGSYGADISVWAAEQGYDAIKVRVDRQEQGEEYYTVLRRSALWIQK